MVKHIQGLFEKWPQPIMSNHEPLPYCTFFFERCLAALAANGSCFAAGLQHRQIIPRGCFCFLLLFFISSHLNWAGMGFRLTLNTLRAQIFRFVNKCFNAQSAFESLARVNLINAFAFEVDPSATGSAS